MLIGIDRILAMTPQSFAQPQSMAERLHAISEDCARRIKELRLQENLKSQQRANNPSLAEQCADNLNEPLSLSRSH